MGSPFPHFFCKKYLQSRCVCVYTKSMITIKHIPAPRIGTLAPAGGVRWERPHHSTTLPQRIDLRLDGGLEHRDALRGRLVSLEAPAARFIEQTECSLSTGHHAQEAVRTALTEVNVGELVDCQGGGVIAPAHTSARGER